MDITVLNVRNMPKQVLQNFKARCAIESLTMQEGVILLLQAVGEGRIQLEDLVLREEKKS